MPHSVQDRAAGAVMGAFIGDALGLGPHWYYNLDEMRREYGEWITDYTDPKPDRYHSGMKAGELSQAGIILKMLLSSLVELGHYDEEDFCARMDEELFPHLDGTPEKGPGGFTSVSIREAWKCRVEHGLPWGQAASNADTTEAIERTLALAVRYALQPEKLAAAVSSNTVLTQHDEVVVSMTVAFGAVLAQLIQGHHLNSAISGRLMKQVRNGELPFHSVTQSALNKTSSAPRAGQFMSPDSLLTSGNIAAAAVDSAIQIEPAWKVSLVYGMPCAIYHVLPAAYYLSARFHDDFESAVLHAVNGGGQNQSRAILAGALAGAQVGISGIPYRFIEDLEHGEELSRLAEKLAAQVGSFS